MFDSPAKTTSAPKKEFGLLVTSTVPCVFQLDYGCGIESVGLWRPVNNTKEKAFGIPDTCSGCKAQGSYLALWPVDDSNRICGSESPSAGCTYIKTIYNKHC